MAAVRLKCTFFGYFLFFCVLAVSAKSSNDFLPYQVDELSSIAIDKEDIVLLDRYKRYVETAIPRLADNYYRQEVYPGKHLDKDDIDSFSRRRGRMEMLGNLAVNADDLAMSSIHSDDSLKDQREATENAAVPEKVTKKPSGTGSKKNLEPHQEKTLSKGDDNVHNVSTDNSNQTEPSHTVVNTTPISLHTTEKSTSDSDDLTINSTPSHQETGGMHQEGAKKVAGDGTSHGDYSGTSDDGTTTDFTDGDYPKDITNNTLLKNNITEKQEDLHSYYNSTFITDSAFVKQYWVNMENEKNGIISEMLSKSHRRAATVKLSFDFPFYGHLLQQVTIATGGFLYTGNYIHSWLAATQYIAPLMANFDTGLSDDSHVRYSDNGSSFTVEWDRVHLQDKKEAGQFTFQVTLYKNGDIVFVYKDVPILVENIEDDQHPVKVGLSDAYIIDRTVFFVRRKTIYEYHRVNFKREDIKNWTVIYMSALPTCLTYTDCNSCVLKDSVFNCKWCPAVNRCSSGYDRFRQEWLLNQCQHSEINTTDGCQLAANASSILSERHRQMNNALNNVNSQAATDTKMDQKSGHLGHSGLLGLLFFVLIISGLSLWLLYAYRNPHTTSGQVLIKYRPSQWSLRRGEARYTAASIHM